MEVKCIGKAHVLLLIQYMIMHLFQICDAVLASGPEHVSEEQDPGTYPSHVWVVSGEYVGAAHGLAGIYYYLMQVNSITRDTFLTEEGTNLGK